MKRKLLWVVLVGICVQFAHAPALAENVLDPYLRLVLHGNVSATGPTKSALGIQQGQDLALLIKTTDAAQLKDFFDRTGAKWQGEAGDIVSAVISSDGLEELEHLPGVVYVEQAKPLQTKLDRSRALIGADVVQDGKDLPRQYTGAGVIVGIVDSGIDWQHPAFESRLLALWDQTHAPTAAWKPPTELPNPYGIECLPQHFTTKTCPARDDLGHGTHVAGIAASGETSYAGIAPDAELLVVGMGGVQLPDDSDITPTAADFAQKSTAVVNGVEYIFKKAEALGEPAVVNLSLGTHFGAHDGSSLFEQALNALVDGKEGRAIVVSAGNENHQSSGTLASVHAGYTLAGEAFATEFVAGDSQSHALLLDIWSAPGSALSFAIGVDGYRTYESSPPTALGTTTTYRTTDQKLDIVIDATETANPLNGKQHTVIAITAVGKNDGVAPTNAKYTFDLLVSGTGAFDAWLPVGGVFTKRTGMYSRTGSTYRAGNSHHTVAIPATAASVISVASFASRDQLGSLFPADHFTKYSWTPVGAISPFSSRGPSVAPADTGQKPDIAAPGEWVVSALSRDAKADFEQKKTPRDMVEQHVLLEGTSMAAPHVTGAVALLFQRNPHLTAAAVKHLLCLNATADAAVGEAPNNAWGFGKLNIAQAMKNFDSTPLDGTLPYSETNLVETAAADADTAVNPEAGEGGCSLVPETSLAQRVSSWALLMLILPALYGIIRCFGKRGVAGRAGLLLCGVFLVVGCGGSTDPAGGVLLNTDLSVKNALNLKENGVAVSVDGDAAVFVAIDREALQAVAIAVPLEHFQSGETIALGGDNLLDHNPDEAVLSIITFSDKDMTTPVSAYVALEGHVTITEAALNNDALISGTVADAMLYPVDLTSSLVKRGMDGTPLAGSFRSTVKKGGVLNPIILSTTPNGGPRGTTVTVTGFNLSSVTGASICEHKMSATPVSPQRVTFLVDALPCAEGTVNLIVGNASFPIDSKRPFRLEFSDTVVTPLLHPIGQVVYNAARNLVFLYSEGSKSIDIFSVTEHAFHAPLTFPALLHTFDVNQRGDRLVACGAMTTQPSVMVAKLDDLGALQMIPLPKGGWCTDSAFGQGNQALLISKNATGAEAIAVVDLADFSVTYPTALKASVSEQRFLKGASGKTIVLQPPTGTSGYEMTVYRSGDDGVFVKGKQTISFFDHLVAVSSSGDQLWGKSGVYGFDLQLVGSFGDATFAWGQTNSFAHGIAFPENDAFAVLSTGSHLIDLVEPSSRKVLASKIRILGAELNPLRTFVSADGTTLILVDTTNLYLVNLAALLKQ